MQFIFFIQQDEIQKISRQEHKSPKSHFQPAANPQNSPNSSVVSNQMLIKAKEWQRAKTDKSLEKKSSSKGQKSPKKNETLYPKSQNNYSIGASLIKNQIGNSQQPTFDIYALPIAASSSSSNSTVCFEKEKEISKKNNEDPRRRPGLSAGQSRLTNSPRKEEKKSVDKKKEKELKNEIKFESGKNTKRLSGHQSEQASQRENSPFETVSCLYLFLIVLIILI